MILLRIDGRGGMLEQVTYWEDMAIVKMKDCRAVAIKMENEWRDLRNILEIDSMGMVSNLWCGVKEKKD